MIDWSQVIQIAQFVLWAVLGVYSWQSSRHRATREHVERVEQSVQSLTARVDVFEERVQHLPSREELAGLYTEVKVLSERLQGTTRAVDRLELQLNRVDTFLRGNG